MKIRVLIVDDHTVLRDGLQSILSAMPNIQVVGQAANGRMAIALARELLPDVVLMDIAMPGMSGLDAAREILAYKPETRVVILSMLGSSEHVYQALKVGVSGYLLKESAGSEVADAVLCVAGGQRYFSRPVTDTLVEDYLQNRDLRLQKSPLESLSFREREVLNLVVQGSSSTEIGELLHLSPKTVESYRSRIMQKLGVSDLAGLIRFAYLNGLIPLSR